MRSGILMVFLGQALTVFGAHHVRTGTATVEDFQSFFGTDTGTPSQPFRQSQTQGGSSNFPLTGNQNNNANNFGTQNKLNDNEGNRNNNFVGSPGNRNDNSFGSQSNRNDNSFGSQSNRNDNSFGSQSNRNDNSFGSQSNRNDNSFGSQSNRNDNSFGSQSNRNDNSFGSQSNRNDNSFGSQRNRNDNSFGSQGNRNDNSFGSQGNRNDNFFGSQGNNEEEFYWRQLGGLDEFDTNIFHNWDSFGSGSGNSGNNPEPPKNSGPGSGSPGGREEPEEFDDEEFEEEEDDDDDEEVEERSGSSNSAQSSGSSGASKPKCQKMSQNSLVPGPNNKDYYFSWSEERSPGKGESWIKARDFCQSRCMDLAAIETPKENNFVADELQRAKYVEGAWIGARLCFSQPECPKNSHWYWVSSKKKLPQTGSWSRTGGLGEPQPDNLCQYYGGPREECGAMLNNWYRDGIRWHDLACAQRLGFVCEIKAISAPKSSSTRGKRSARMLRRDGFSRRHHAIPLRANNRNQSYRNGPRNNNWKPRNGGSRRNSARFYYNTDRR